MKNLIRIALILLLVAIGVHSYLAYHHYEMTFGSAGPSICNINATFDCDAVNASSYSQFLGFPLALWGALTNFALVIVLLGAMWLESNEAERWHRTGALLSLVIALSSVIMGAISTMKLGTFCLFCIAAYILSFANLGLVWSSSPTSVWRHLPGDLSAMFTRKRGLLGVLLIIPFGVWIVDQMALKSFAGGPITQLIESSVREWKSEKPHKFDVEGAVLEMGAPAEQAKVTLVEYADFRCPHCKDAAPKLHAFVRAHPDTRLVFMAFPLDGECNPDIQHRNGVSCRLAKAAHCAIQFQKGWEMHDFLFSKQMEFHTLEDVNRILEPQAQTMGLNWSEYTACIDSSETQDRIQARARLASQAGLQGTPTVYVNGRQLNGAQILPVLQAAYNEALKGQ